MLRKLLIAVILVIVIVGSCAVWFWMRHVYVLPLEIRIGALLPSTSGDLVLNREKMINGMELAREDLLAKYQGRIKIDFYFEDGCFARDSIPAVQKFIHDNVSIIGASFCLFGHIPILPMTEANKIITFNTAANPDRTLNLHYAFSTNVEVKDEAVKLSEFAYMKLGARRAVTMFLDTPFGHDYDKYFTRDFTRRGGQVVGSFPNAPDGKEFDSMIKKIKALNPDIIVTAHFGLPLAKFIKEVRKADIKAPILGNYETEDLTVINYAGAAAEGVMFSSSELDNMTPTMREFEKRYIRKFGVQPSELVTNSYDNIILGVESYIKCRGDRDCMASELHKVSGYEGVSGIISIKPSNATDKPTVFKIIKNHTFMRYDEL